jgi:hypothetical protein
MIKEKEKSMNRGKVVSGIAALAIYLLLIFSILFFYNIHKTKAKNYVEKNENRVTVTLVNSNKTVLNRSDKVSNKNKPTPMISPVPLKRPKKLEPKKSLPKKTIPKKVSPPKIIPKKITPPKKVAPRKVVPKRVPKKIVPKKKVPKKVVPKKIAPKKAPSKKRVPKKVPKKKVPKKVVPKKKTPKKSAKDLFSRVKTKDVSKRPAKKAPSKRPSTSSKRPSSIKHRSSVADRIKRSHQSGRTSNANRDRGIKNAYIAKVKRHMNNWHAGASHKGQRVTISLTIYNSGKFSYKIIKGSGSIRGSLNQYLNQLKRMGLGRHNKSTPYSIVVNFTVR